MPSERSSDVGFEIGHVSPPEPAIGDQLNECESDYATKQGDDHFCALAARV